MKKIIMSIYLICTANSASLYRGRYDGKFEEDVNTFNKHADEIANDVLRQIQGKMDIGKSIENDEEKKGTIILALRSFDSIQEDQEDEKAAEEGDTLKPMEGIKSNGRNNYKIMESINEFQMNIINLEETVHNLPFIGDHRRLQNEGNDGKEGKNNKKEEKIEKNRNIQHSHDESVIKSFQVLNTLGLVIIDYKETASFEEVSNTIRHIWNTNPDVFLIESDLSIEQRVDNHTDNHHIDNNVDHSIDDRIDDDIHNNIDDDIHNNIDNVIDNNSEEKFINEENKITGETDDLNKTNQNIDINMNIDIETDNNNQRIRNFVENNQNRDMDINGEINEKIKNNFKTNNDIDNIDYIGYIHIIDNTDNILETRLDNPDTFIPNIKQGYKYLQNKINNEDKLENKVEKKKNDQNTKQSINSKTSQQENNIYRELQSKNGNTADIIKNNIKKNVQKYKNSVPSNQIENRKIAEDISKLNTEKLPIFNIQNIPKLDTVKIANMGNLENIIQRGVYEKVGQNLTKNLNDNFDNIGKRFTKTITQNNQNIHRKTQTYDDTYDRYKAKNINRNIKNNIENFNNTTQYLYTDNITHQMPILNQNPILNMPPFLDSHPDFFGLDEKMNKNREALYEQLAYRGKMIEQYEKLYGSMNNKDSNNIGLLNKINTNNTSNESNEISEIALYKKNPETRSKRAREERHDRNIDIIINEMNKPEYNNEVNGKKNKISNKEKNEKINSEINNSEINSNEINNETNKKINKNKDNNMNNAIFKQANSEKNGSAEWKNEKKSINNEILLDKRMIKSYNNINDNYFPYQWYLENNNENVDIRITAAWPLIYKESGERRVETWSKEIDSRKNGGNTRNNNEKIQLNSRNNSGKNYYDNRVAHIDTGVFLQHPDLINSIWINPGEIPNNGIDDDGNGYIDDVNGWNFNNNSPDVTDYNGHGTHTAGILGAESNNRIGITGVSWDTKMVIIKFDRYVSQAVMAIEYTLKENIRISTNSWGYTTPHQALQIAIERTYKKNHLFVCAVDNRGLDNTVNNDYPPNFKFPNLLRVASVSNKGILHKTSNYGYKNVDIAAPGVHILSTVPKTTSTTLYDYKDGTSMATPQVAGLASLLMSLKPEANIYEIKNIIMSTATPLQALQDKIISGGIINAYQAVMKILGREYTEEKPVSFQAARPVQATDIMSLIWGNVFS